MTTDPILAEIEQNIANIKATWDEKTKTDATVISELFENAIKGAKIDPTRIRQDLREAIKSKFKDVYDAHVTNHGEISAAVCIDLAKVWKDILGRHYIIDNKTYVYKGILTYIPNESPFFGYIKTLPPVQSIITMLEKEFPAAGVWFGLEFRDGYKTMIFKVKYDYTALIDKLPKVRITN